MIKKLQVMSALFVAKRPEADKMAAGLIDGSDLQTTFMILDRVRGLLRSDHLGQMFKLDSPRARFEKILEIARHRHGTQGEIFGPIFERMDLRDEIVNRRSYVTNAEHRFFMALLLNADGRERVFLLIKQRFPDAVRAWEQALTGDGENIDRAAIEKKLREARGKTPPPTPADR
jgi:hypothetical protein